VMLFTDELILDMVARIRAFTARDKAASRGDVAK
jgi:hypothetical protein